MKSIKEDIEEIVQTARCGNYNIEHFVLGNGVEHFRHPNPQRYHTPSKTIGQCFHNAYILVSRYRNELFYAEGYAHKKDSPMPIHHAWAVTANGEFIDPTWKDGIDYFGVPFDFEYVTGIAFRAEEFSGVIFNHRDQCPLLTGKATNWRPKVKTVTAKP